MSNRAKMVKSTIDFLKSGWTTLV